MTQLMDLSLSKPKTHRICSGLSVVRGLAKKANRGWATRRGAAPSRFSFLKNWANLSHRGSASPRLHRWAVLAVSFERTGVPFALPFMVVQPVGRRIVATALKEQRQVESNELGTFGEAFTPSILTILGVILFMRPRHFFAGGLEGFRGTGAPP